MREVDLLARLNVKWHDFLQLFVSSYILQSSDLEILREITVKKFIEVRHLNGMEYV